MNPTRRQIIQIASAGAAGVCGIPVLSQGIKSDIQKGDLLMSAKGDIKQPLKVQDIPIGVKPVLAYAMDPATQKLRDATRMDKLLLLRFDEADLTPEAKAIAVSGVLAFSAICTHQGCEVTEWSKNDKSLLCFCHLSKFNPLQTGSVVKGPASKSLPWIGLTSDSDVLAINSGFSAKPGA